MTHYNTYLKGPFELSRANRGEPEDNGQQNQDPPPQQQQLAVIPFVPIKTEENVEPVQVPDVARAGDEQGGGVLPSSVAAAAVPQSSQSCSRSETPRSVVSSGGGGPKKRLRTATVLEEVDKKFLLEQYVSERQKNVNVQLQNRVSQLERELREQERLSTEKEKIHLETLALAENHHRETVLAEVGRLLEAEFNCSICNEVFIEPAVLNCGHTYCSYCINRALQTDFLCPICRTGYNFNPPAKNIEMRNFINKLFQMLPEELRSTRDTVLEERAALPVPAAGSNNARSRTRRRRSRSASPFDLLGLFNDEDAFRERRSRSRSASSTWTDSDDSDNALNFFDLRASPRSPSPETASRPPRRQTRSRSPTIRTRRGRRSPHSRGYLGGILPLPWRNPYGSSPSAPAAAAAAARPSQSSLSSPTMRFVQSPNHEDELAERRLRQQVARARGRATSSGRSFSGTVSGPRRYGWGPPRRLVHSNSLNRGVGGETNNNNNNNNDTNNPSSSSGNNNNNDVGVGGNDGGIGSELRRRMATGYNNPYRLGRWGAYGGGPTRLSREPTALRIPVLTPRLVRRPLEISDNFEDLFTRRDPASNRIAAMPLPPPPSSATTTTTVAAVTPPTLQQPLNHDHSYTSPNSSRSDALAALNAARSRTSASSSINSQQQGEGGGNNGTRNSSDALLEQLQEQTRRLHAATNSFAAFSNRNQSSGGQGGLSQALTEMITPSAPDNNNTVSAVGGGGVAAESGFGNNSNNSPVEEPRRSPRIARQFRHRFLTPTTITSMEGDRDQDIMRDRNSNMSLVEQNSQSRSGQTPTNSQGSSSNPSQGQGESSQSQQNYGSSQETSQDGGGYRRRMGPSSSSIVSSTGGTRGSSGSVADSPTSSEIDALSAPTPPIDDAGLSAMRRFVHNLHSYRTGSRDGGGTGREGREDRERGARGERDSSRRSNNNTAGGSSSRSSRERRRRNSVELLEEMDLF